MKKFRHTKDHAEAIRAHDRLFYELVKQLRKCDYCGLNDQYVENHSFDDEAPEKEPFIADATHPACIRSKANIERVEIIERRLEKVEQRVAMIGEFFNPLVIATRKVLFFVRNRR